MRLVLVVVLGLLALGCDRTIRADDYNRSCTMDSECTLVTEGDVCPQTCSCPNAAVNDDASIEFTTDRGSQARTCPPRFVGASEAANCAPCGVVARCVSNRCEARPQN